VLLFYPTQPIISTTIIIFSNSNIGDSHKKLIFIVDDLSIIFHFYWSISGQMIIYEALEIIKLSAGI
jgi:hypothetical protein